MGEKALFRADLGFAHCLRALSWGERDPKDNDLHPVLRLDMGDSEAASRDELTMQLLEFTWGMPLMVAVALPVPGCSPRT